MPAAGAEPKRLLVVDDHPILRRGLTALIESEPGLAVHAAVGTRAAALAAMRESNRIWRSSIFRLATRTAWTSSRK